VQADSIPAERTPADPTGAVSSFASVSAVTARGGGIYDIGVSPDWTIVGKPNGGYLLAMLGRAAVAEVAQTQVLAASAHYLRPPEPGPATIETEVLRAGRSASQVRSRLSQAGQACVEALLTLGEPAGGAGEFECTGIDDADVAPWEECIRLPSAGPGGMAVTIMDQLDVRLDPATLGFASGRPSGRGELAGWLALPGGVDFDHISLLLAVDCYPPATFDIGMSGWVPTLELTAYVRAVPAPGPVRVRQQVGVIEGSRVDESCRVWDSTGHLVAQSTQLAGIRIQPTRPGTG
jgi:acyl-coenzyme A thioesterase PaaI-like protein